MSVTEAEAERVSRGLPVDPVDVPAEFLDALEQGRIGGKDLHHNMYAHIRAAYPVPSEVVPPLNVYEEVERGRRIHEIARISITHLI